MLTIGSTSIAYEVMRSSELTGTPHCAYLNGTATGTCACEVDPELTIVTGRKARSIDKMIQDIQYDFQIDPTTLLRLGVLVPLTYKRQGPNVGYL